MADTPPSKPAVEAKPPAAETPVTPTDPAVPPAAEVAAAPPADAAAATAVSPEAAAEASVPESAPAAAAEPVAEIAATEATAPIAEAKAPAAEAEPIDPDQAAVDELLRQANFEDPSAAGGSQPAADAEPFELPAFQQVMQEAQMSSIDLLRDVELNVKIELGRNRMLVEDVLKLAEGSVVELDKLAGDPVDVFVNDRHVARREVLVLNDNFCVRVNEIVAGAREECL
jgi:flagellar motor switch protein FliN/FliY